ncbi:pyridine nucleotide-disulfide oxidoreductase [Sulfolobus sp. A20]|uniref:NAD(P)/FAD-dependent oxidoreductase n=1 Tax=Sulfolobaceae TaxID=118883 RepID=UPI000846272E|nr:MULTISPECIES: FAD-dependent oxidoreductase [unclassified Sulfolobus]TRM76798.1 FAD-dependent oxidoreductase [Sulfolobus sp. A20-N-F8]TRM81372.1 FAD-dependent oxidoreductase [Sulfolobus sp. D5]TRM83678.1 FAD-dependent oxidoreductase [Sulfolobus sp. A20-N-F6]TRM88291.1 FAD-dependent oxidoreductase [Sulfolobus sp. E3]TRM95246.1 FAD-dependent oxidoreductase [Sulfolobus sp. A20-N-G8]TRN03547.1 FAD-dependent oxidoreductase [Sulfolobus sp. E1]TRN03658.1 FAD-dependent oxidoreductase [Sulfolobus s
MIVIVGGGFSGNSAHNQNKDSIIIDRKDYFLLTPWLIDFICGMKTLNDIIIKYKNVIVGELEKIDFNDKKIILSNSKEIRYDKLILALGHHQNLPRLKGPREYAHKIETLQDAFYLKKRLNEVKDIAIVGGGATGVELAGNIRGKRVTLIQRRNRLLPTMTTASSKKAEEILNELGVNLMLGVEAIEVLKDGVLTSHGKVKSELTIFAGGLKGPQIIDTLQHANKNHRMIVDRYLKSVEHKDVYGAGDCITFEDSDIPMSADVAVSSGKIAMRNALGEEIKFEPKRSATIIRIRDEFFGDFGNNYVEGNFAKLLRSIAYAESLLLPSKESFNTKI